MKNLLARLACAVSGGHDFTRYGNCLVCEFCGEWRLIGRGAR